MNSPKKFQTLERAATPRRPWLERLRKPVRRFPLTVALLASIVVVAGCGDQRPKRVQIAGKVLIDGQPLTFGIVRFVPDDGRPSTAKLEADGRFALQCFDEADGAVLGRHRIAIYANEALDDKRTRWHAPPKYAKITTSGLEQQITEPNDALVIELTWDGGKPFIDIDRSSEDDPKGLKRRSAVQGSAAQSPK